MTCTGPTVMRRSLESTSSLPAGLEQAAKGWRRLRGHRSMPVLLAGLKRHVDGINEEVNADRVAA